MMTEASYSKDVGSADPELKTSPIAEENDDETVVLKQEMPGESVCFFNGQSFPTGSYVKSGNALLKCDYGIWVPAGSADPDNP